MDTAKRKHKHLYDFDFGEALISMLLHMHTPTRKMVLRRGGRLEHGFTLIELMIGVLIGALSTLVIAKVFAFSEGQRRATTTGSDAQVNGALALYAIQRDAEMAGYGMTASLDALGCPIQGRFGGTNYAWTLAPVQITAGGGGAPDTINFMGSATTRYSMPTRVTSDHLKTDTTFFTSTTIGLAPGDLMIAVPKTIDVNNWCSVFSITSLAGSNQVLHASGVGWNPPAGQEIFPNAGYLATSYLLSLGSFINRTYSIGANSALALTSFDSATGTSSATELFPAIVQLQAFYGKDTDGDGVIDTYDKVTPTTNAAWRQVIAVRVALVARSSQFEKEQVTASNPLWDVGTAVPVSGSATCGSSKCVTLKVDMLTDWQRYRYRVYDVVVPLRNVLWHA
jgi:type IV pilus assembly protein PilW